MRKRQQGGKISTTERGVGCYDAVILGCDKTVNNALALIFSFVGNLLLNVSMLVAMQFTGQIRCEFDETAQGILAVYNQCMGLLEFFVRLKSFTAIQSAQTMSLYDSNVKDQRVPLSPL